MADLVKIKLSINRRDVDIATEPDRTLLEVLREDLVLTGTKYGCGEGACGACSVLVDGKRIFSCSTPVSDVVGKSITTIEGIADGDQLHPVQQAYLDASGFQCGYCTSGMIIATIALLTRTPSPTNDELCDGMNGNLCRCCGYASIKEAVNRAAKATASAGTGLSQK